MHISINRRPKAVDFKNIDALQAWLRHLKRSAHPDD
jgi:hypothetical protein